MVTSKDKRGAKGLKVGSNDGPVHSTEAKQQWPLVLALDLILSQVNHLTRPVPPNPFIFNLTPEHFIEENTKTL